MSFQRNINNYHFKNKNIPMLLALQAMGNASLAKMSPEYGLCKLHIYYKCCAN
jgi:hypothetical protein